MSAEPEGAWWRGAACEVAGRGVGGGGSPAGTLSHALWKQQ